MHSKVLQMVNYRLWSNIRALARSASSRPSTTTSGFRRTVSSSCRRWARSHQASPRNRGKEGGHSGRTWKVVCDISVEDKTEPSPKTGRVVGMNMGIKHFLTDTEGRQIENPRFYEKSLKRIRKLHRQLSHKQRDNHEKARVRLARHTKSS